MTAETSGGEWRRSPLGFDRVRGRQSGRLEAFSDAVNRFLRHPAGGLARGAADLHRAVWRYLIMAGMAIFEPAEETLAALTEGRAERVTRWELETSRVKLLIAGGDGVIRTVRAIFEPK